jgi:hypothetical protein
MKVWCKREREEVSENLFWNAKHNVWVHTIQPRHTVGGTIVDENDDPPDWEATDAEILDTEDV